MTYAIWTPRGALRVYPGDTYDTPGPMGEYSTWKTERGAKAALARVLDRNSGTRYEHETADAVVGPDVVLQHCSRACAWIERDRTVQP